MRKTKNSQLNNSGSTLIIVLVMVAFVTVLSLVVTTAAMTNLKMKLVDKQATKTFYTAEDAVDEIYAALGKTSMECFDSAYTEQLSSIVSNEQVDYTLSDNLKYNETLRVNYMDRVISALLGNITTITKSLDNNKVIYVYASNSSDKSYYVEVLNSFLENKSIKVKSVDNIEITNEYSDTSKIENYAFVFTNCLVEYESEEGYFSNITFNGNISMPDSIIDFVTASKEGIDTFMQYSLIGNKGITIAGAEKSDGVVNGNVTISDNFYAGKGSENISGGLFVDKSSELNVTNGTCISSGDINIADNASMIVESEDVWCKNILLNGNGSKLNIGIGCNTYVNDDLQIDGNNVSVSMAGNYFGFGYKSEGNSNPHTSMSAIIINGKSADLNFTNIATMVIAGNAYIDYSKKMLPSSFETLNNTISGNDTFYNTGNSIDYIGTQEIYLVPTLLMGENQPNPNVSSDLKLEITEDAFFGYKYLDKSNPYVKKNIEGKTYYYLNFLVDASGKSTVNEYVKAVLDDDTFSELKADKSEEIKQKYDETRNYVLNVISVNLSDIDSCIEGLDNGNIHTNGSLIKATKNKDGSVSAKLVDNSAYDYESDNEKYSQEYVSLRKFLFKNADSVLMSSNDYETDDIYNNFVDNEKVKLETGEKNNNKPRVETVNGKLVYVTNNENAAIVVGGNEDITGGNYEGIIIATGDVIVKDDFKGLIIAGGKITIQGKVSISNSMSGTTVQTMIENNDLLKTVLKGWNTGDDNENKSDVQIDGLTYKELVSFSDWRKNEEMESN